MDCGSKQAMSGGAAGSGGNMISFAEIVQGRDASVRVTVDGMIYAVDLVMVMTGLNRNDAGQVLRRLPDEVFPSGNLPERNLPGKGRGYVGSNEVEFKILLGNAGREPGVTGISVYLPCKPLALI